LGLLLIFASFMMPSRPEHATGLCLHQLKLRLTQQNLTCTVLQVKLFASNTKCSDAGISHKHKTVTGKENNRPSKKAKKISANPHDTPKSAEFIELSDDKGIKDN
jgi:hypothetical protein